MRAAKTTIVYTILYICSFDFILCCFSIEKLTYNQTKTKNAEPAKVNVLLSIFPPRKQKRHSIHQAVMYDFECKGKSIISFSTLWLSHYNVHFENRNMDLHCALQIFIFFSIYQSYDVECETKREYCSTTKILWISRDKIIHITMQIKSIQFCQHHYHHVLLLYRHYNCKHRKILQLILNNIRRIYDRRQTEATNLIS